MTAQTLSPPHTVEALQACLREHAPGLAPLALRDTDLLRDVLSRPLTLDDDEVSFRTMFMEATQGMVLGPELNRTMRRQRHRAVVRIVLRELLSLADIDQTSREMAFLAAAATEAAIAASRRKFGAQYGYPRDAEGREVPLTVLGMGKLGGNELNLGSDIDLCFFYETDDATVTSDDPAVPSGEVSVHQWFCKVCMGASKTISEVTEDGFVFRVDLRLRPEGSRGPVANSLASAERYYETFGRNWERAAMLRSRPIAGDRKFGARMKQMLRPFVFRKSVDPSIASEMSAMLAKGRREAGSHPDDIKLGRGGIREAEFFVQALQLVWGGVRPELQVANTMLALKRLREAGLVTHREAGGLEDHWAFLRRVEHRIHARTAYQTHQLPAKGEARDEFARSLGFDGEASFDARMTSVRADVAALFDTLTTPDDAQDESIEALIDAVVDGEPDAIGRAAVDALPIHDEDAAIAHLRRLARRANSPLGPLSLEKTPDLSRLLLREVRDAADPDGALQRVADFFGRLEGPTGYGKLLLEKPNLTRRLVGLFGASGILADALVLHPESLDQLLLSARRPSVDNILERHDELTQDPASANDREALVTALRKIKREVTLHIGLAFVAGDLTQRALERRMTVLAEAQLRVALAFATRDVYRVHGVPQAEEGQTLPAELCVVGMGKLGARELAFGSDLDLIFVYGADGVCLKEDGSEGKTCAEVFARIAQRTMSILAQPDVQGPGWETDTRLRPSGSKGMLVVSLRAFDRYHETDAQAWERQALIRARPVAGSPEVGQAFLGRAHALAFATEAPSGEQIANMRGRMQKELADEKSGRYDPKVGHGGLVDVEFLVQWLQMHHGEHARVPGTVVIDQTGRHKVAGSSTSPITIEAAVRSPNTLEALRGLQGLGVLSDQDTDELIAGYEFFRAVGQALTLLDHTGPKALVEGGRVASRVARRLGLRERDGMTAEEVLIDTHRRHAIRVRAIFDRVVGPVSERAAWMPRGTTNATQEKA